ncbi:MAG: UbiD family decarboxylase [Betaproteobacteria bacterium]|nr:UbiD family decarboxylase [Betaproteobacteria bacterium]
MQTKTVTPGASIDFDKFRLRPFVDRLIELGEVEVHEQPVPLSRLSAIIESTPKAALFRCAGPQKFEIVASVSGSRRRLAAAFGVAERQLAHEYLRRMNNPQPVVEVPSGDAPVHQRVVTGEDVDLTRLPFHLQHALDGGTYISSAIDYAIDPATGRSNVGCRRLMLRGRRELRSNLTGPTDLRQIYLGCVRRGERLPVSFAVGSHPLDYLAAGLRVPGEEFGLVATLRGEPVPMVRGITNGVPAPADAEMIIEGYFDELGYREIEGPYGEFYGFYGAPHIDPIFHVTAITMRDDVLHQTVRHSGLRMGETDSANLGMITAEGAIWRALRAANIEPAAVYAPPAANGRQHARVAIRRGLPGQARIAIAALFSLAFVKHVFVVDDDVDVFSDEDMEWAMSARFRSDRDLVVSAGYPATYMNPTAGDDGTMPKAGFDLTAPFGDPEDLESRVARAANFSDAKPRYQSVRQALESGPMYFAQLLEALGSDDGREIALELDKLREEGVLSRVEKTGQWALTT